MPPPPEPRQTARQKARARYRSILRWYAAQVYQRVWWFVADEPLRRRLRDLGVDEALDDVLLIEPMPEALRAHASRAGAPLSRGVQPAG